MRSSSIARAAGVFTGLGHADLVVENISMLNVFTGEIQANSVVAAAGERILHAGEKLSELYGPETEIIDGGGRLALPGFIDGHTHLDSMMTFGAFVPWALRGGTTVVVTECAMAANACGIGGVLDFVRSATGFPVKAYFLAPPMVPPLPGLESSAGLTTADFSRLLRRDDFVGVGEAYWTEAVAGKGNFFGKAALARRLRKTVEGHAAGARGNRLRAYFACGVTSCHESVSMEEALTKLENGVHVMIREGFVRRELDALAGLKDFSGDKSRIMLVSDVFDAPMLEKGYLDVIVRRAVKLGFDPVEAVRMVTINVADYFGLRDHGALAPGRYADIVLVDDMREFRISHVVASGAVVVGEGVPPPAMPVPSSARYLKTVLPLHPAPETLAISSSRPRTVRVMEVASPTIMRESSALLPSVDGRLALPPDGGLVAAVMLDRRLGTKRMGGGFIRGTGISAGAVATTLVWDTCNILVLGSAYDAMAAAVGRLTDVGGGIVVTGAGGEILFELPMPLYGLVSLLDVPAIAQAQERLDAALRRIGCRLERPFLNIQTVAFTGLPFLRITDRGLVDIKSLKKVPLFVR